MEKKWEIDFYRDQDEEAFLDAYEEKYGEQTEEEWDVVYDDILVLIKKQLNEGTHTLGKPFYYRDVLVGQSDKNEGHGVYLFSAEN